MNGRRDWADRFARRMLTMHARHGREAGLAVDEVIVDPQPVHIAADCDLVGSHDRHIVLGLASDDAGVAANARRVVDHHRPFVGVVIVGRIECWRICSGLVQAEIGFLQIGKRKTRLQILRFAFQLKEMLGQQQILMTTRLG